MGIRERENRSRPSPWATVPGGRYGLHLPAVRLRSTADQPRSGQAVHNLVAALEGQPGYSYSLWVLSDQKGKQVLIAAHRPALHPPPAEPGKAWVVPGSKHVCTRTTRSIAKDRRQRRVLTAPGQGRQLTYEGNWLACTQQGTTAKGLPAARARSTMKSVACSQHQGVLQQTPVGSAAQWLPGGPSQPTPRHVPDQGACQPPCCTG